MTYGPANAGRLVSKSSRADVINFKGSSFGTYSVHLACGQHSYSRMQRTMIVDTYSVSSSTGPATQYLAAFFEGIVLSILTLLAVLVSGSA